MNTLVRMQPLLRLIAPLLAVAAASGTVQAQERIVVPLTDASRPVVLDVSAFRGSITVSAYEGNEVVLVTRAVQRDDDEGDDEDEQKETPRTDGLRRIPNTSIGLTATEHDNTVSVEMDFSRSRFALDISVPRRTSVHAATVNGGAVTITGVTGEHEISNTNGDIVATDIAGALVANTTNGKVQASFTEVTPAKAMSFSTFNGDVDVSFPANLAATLHINSGRGELLTDFDVEVQPQPAVIERGGENGRYQVRLERETRAVVGRGGPDIYFKTFNGDITIRKR